MSDLDYRFDSYTERFSRHSLDALRSRAKERPLEGPVCVEIGANRGKFLVELAEQNPDKQYLGIELRKSFAEGAQRKIERLGLKNAACIHADANLALPILFDDAQLAELFLLYPDPWWKSRHHKRRIIQPDFLDLLAIKMPVGGKVWIRTDVGPLADDMRDTLILHERFEPLDFDDFPEKPFPWTNREQHCFAAGMPAHLVYFQRV